ncbi:MAG TPA: YihY/virulence factor BrkB family protein [Povalibacter sp.]|nr:YihY/virulence factor BrkB family protein [Povalibacter sp.]
MRLSQTHRVMMSAANVANRDVGAALVRISPGRLLRIAKCSVANWAHDNSATTGAALAFYSAFSLAPLLIIVLTITGWVVGLETAYGYLHSQLTSLFGSASAETLIEAMRNSQSTRGGIAAAISVVTLVIGATTVFAALESALEIIWQSAQLVPGGWKGWVRARLLSFGVMLAVGFLLLVSLTITTALSALRSSVVLRDAVWVGVTMVVDLLVSLTVVTGMIAMIYRFMPVRRLAWRPIVWGALVTALLFHAGKWTIGLYLAHSTQPSVFGAAASFVALLLWLYYSAQIFLLGAEFTACLAGVERKPQETKLPAREPVRRANTRSKRR